MDVNLLLGWARITCPTRYSQTGSLFDGCLFTLGEEHGDAWEPHDSMKEVSVLENPKLAPFFSVIQTVRLDVGRG